MAIYQGYGAPAQKQGPYGPSSGNPGDETSPELEIRGRPTIAINVPATAAGVRLTTRDCLLVGWSLRETTGAAPALVELIDGGDTTGSPVAEIAIPAPPLGEGGGTVTDVDASSATAASANNVTLPGVAGATTFITGFEITGDGATAGSIIAVTVTGILGGTKTYYITVPVGAGVAITPLIVEFARPIPASAPNTGITVNVPSFGAGNTNAAVTAHGFQATTPVSGANLGQSQTDGPGVDGPYCRIGLFLRVISGSVTGAVWVKQ